MPEPKYTLETLLRGLNILSLYTRETPALTLTEITKAINLNKTTVYRILTTLENTGYLIRDPDTKRYRPGIKVLQLGFTAISSLEVRQVAHRDLEFLSQRVGETVSLSILDVPDIIYVDRVRNQAIVGVVLGIGSRLPAHCASMGKAMLAHLPSDELRQYLDQTPLKACTPNTIVDPQSLENELALVRKQGFATNDEELEIGLRAVAAPIWDHTSRAIAAVNVTGSSSSITNTRLVGELAESVRETAAQISQALGYKKGIFQLEP
jgi:PcaR/PcaU/PobR family beta-ketoadipate pathway transcriptional regulator